MERFLRGVYAVSIVLPIVYQGLIHLYGWGKDTLVDIRDNFLEAWRG